MTTTVEGVLAKHVELSSLKIPPSTVVAVKGALLDTLACMIAGNNSPECQNMQTILRMRGGIAESTAVGCNQRMPLTSAALCNAMQAHWYEWDDLHDVAVSHTSAVIWPVLLATAEAAGMDGPEAGAELIAAAAVAYDVATHVGKSITPFAHYGWHATAHGSAVGAAAGAARLWGLSTEGVLSAMGLAATAASLTRQPLLDRVNGKNALCAQAVSAAMTAVDLARSGVKGAPSFLTGNYGFIALMSGGVGKPEVGIDELGVKFAVEEMSIKPYPCCRAVHQGIDLALQMREKNPEIAKDIQNIQIQVPQPSYDMVGKPFEPGENPRVSAQFSMSYTIALAFLKGRVGLKDFDANQIIADKQVSAFSRLVEVFSFPLSAGQGQYDLPVTLTCILKNGSEHTRSTALVKGSPMHPLNTQERYSKLLDCAEGHVSLDDVLRLQSAVEHLEVKGIAPVMSILGK